MRTTDGDCNSGETHTHTHIYEKCVTYTTQNYKSIILKLI